MKQYFFFFLFALTIIFCAPLTSCGDDNEKDEPTKQGLSKEAAAFVGYWVAEEGTSSWDLEYSDLMLYDDGTCVTSIYKNDRGLNYNDWNSPNHGIWSYNHDTKLLSNSANERTYEVSRIDDKSMLCIDIQTKETIEYKKKNNELRVAQIALAGTWVSAQGDSIFIPFSDWDEKVTHHDYGKQINLSSSMYETLKSFLYQGYDWYLTNMNPDYFYKLECTDKPYTYYYQLITRWHNDDNKEQAIAVFDGKLIIDEIFSPQKQKITFKDREFYTKFEGTFYKKAQWWESNNRFSK
jgi:hypothetical protein